MSWIPCIRGNVLSCSPPTISSKAWRCVMRWPSRWMDGWCIRKRSPALTRRNSGTHTLNAWGKENDCLQGLLLCPVDRAEIYVGKFLANCVFTIVMGFFVFIFFAALYNVDVLAVGFPLAVIVVLAAVGFSSVGTLFAAVSVGLKARDVLLAILLFPVMVPVILAAAKASGVVLDGSGLGSQGFGWVFCWSMMWCSSQSR